MARFFGYDNIPVSLPTGSSDTDIVGGILFDERVKVRAMDTAEALGFSQSLTYSFESPKVFDKLRLKGDAPERNTVKILNPLGEDFSVMRTLPINGMLTSLSNNFNRRNKNVRLYELAKVYIPVEGEDLPDERTDFTLGFYGEGDFFDLKGVAEVFFERLGMNDKRTYTAAEDIPYMHPGRTARISYNGEEIGYLGEVHPKVLSDYGIEEKTYIAVLDLNSIEQFVSFDTKYKGIANYPSVTRDISFVMPKDVPVGDAEEIIEKCTGKLLESYSLFDLYEGDRIQEGFKSVAFNITFRAKDRTLTDDDVNPIMDKLFEELKSKGFELRQ